MQQAESQESFQKLEEERLSLPDSPPEQEVPVRIPIPYDDAASDGGSSGKDEPISGFWKSSASSSTIYRFFFDEESDPSKIFMLLAFLFTVSIAQFVPFYQGLNETLPYIECSSNFCIAQDFETIEGKLTTLCASADAMMGETHYFSGFHRFLLGLIAIITNFFSLLGVILLFYRWKPLFGELHYFKVVAYFGIQMLLFFLSTAVIKVIDWANMKPDAEYSIVPVDVSGCINPSVVYSYYRPDDVHNQYWIIAAIYFPLFIISIFRFLWDSIKLHDCNEWSFSFMTTIVASSTLAGWIFVLIINYATGMQFSVLSDSSLHFRHQQIVNFTMSGLIFVVSIIYFLYKRSSSTPKEVLVDDNTKEVDDNREVS